MKGIYSSIFSHAPNKLAVKPIDVAQWYVKVTGSATPNDNKNNNDNDDNSLSDGEIADN